MKSVFRKERLESCIAFCLISLKQIYLLKCRSFMSKPSSKTPKLTLETAIATFGAAASEKLSNIAASGEPEDQLRAPFEALMADLAELSCVGRENVVCVGESSLSELKTRPD